MFGSTWWTNQSDLDDDQRQVIALAIGSSHLVVGPAGSGKTNVLLLRASYLHASGKKDVIVLTLGRVLREFLVSGSENYSFSSDKIMTYVSWATSVAQACGVDVHQTGSFDEIRSRLLAALQSLNQSQVQAHSCDCLMLDEVQDYSSEEIEVLAKFAPFIFAAGDDRQKITNAKGGLKKCEEICGGVSVELTHHYRNGIKICRVADGIMNVLDDEDGMEATSKYDEESMESSVRVEVLQGVEKQVELAVKEIEKQLVAYPNELIGILCPKLEDFDLAVEAIKISSIAGVTQYQKYLAGYVPLQPDKRVLVASVHGAKGLEFRAVHIVATQNIKRFQVQRSLSYTAVTRAKTSLRIYYSGSLPGYFERGIAAAEDGAGSVPTIESLFKKGK